MGGNDQGQDRVQPQPAGQGHGGHAGNDADRGPHVGHEVGAVCLEGDRADPLALLGAGAGFEDL